jgi:prepilin-type N-terminal cleavage/methylation domain-containing protein
MKMFSGFSLLELLIAMMIMGLNTSIAVPSYTKIQRNAKENVVKGIGYTVQMALESYYLTHGDYPAGLAMNVGDLEAILVQSEHLPKVHENPFTKLPFSSSDSSGLMEYTYDTSTQKYQLEVYGYLNQSVVLVLVN